MYRLLVAILLPTAVHLIATKKLEVEDGNNKNCFGGIMAYEKTAGVVFKVPPSQVLIASSDQAVTPDCAALCRQTNSCLAFTNEYRTGRCQAFDRDSIGRRELLMPQIGNNYFEEVCYRGVSDYGNICGSRIWAFERTVGAFLEGFDDKEEKNVASKVDCERLCLAEKTFTCRSCEYDDLRQLCRLSREDRRTQPLAFKHSPASSVDYLENQCIKPTASCQYEIRNGVNVIALDDLQYASNPDECQKTCDKTALFSCWAYAFDSRQSRCYLSGDDTSSRATPVTSLPVRPGFVYGERKCPSDACINGIMTYEKITVSTLRNAIQEQINVNTVGQGITLDCLKGCKDLGPQCPSVLVDYGTNKCLRLDRNSQGRDSDVIPYNTHSYFEQICLRVTGQACHGKAWAFERVVRHEILGHDNKILYATQSRRECEESCLKETGFVCRSAEYDYATTECRLSKEDRRTQPAAYAATTRNVDYLENQCLGADLTCRLEKKEYMSPALVEFIQPQMRTDEECLNACSSFRGFTCRSVGFRPNTQECLISNDDHASARGVFSENHPETILYERTCLMSRGGFGHPFEHSPPPSYYEKGGDTNYLPTPQASSSYLGGRCPSSGQGFIEYEKTTGYVLKVDLMSTLVSDGDRRGITKECKDLCDLDSDCLAFNLDYNSSECISLRRDSTLNRHDLEITLATGYFEPICFKARGCGRLWTYERHLNKELRGHSKDIIQGITKAECEERCLLEIRFPCRAAVYNQATSECRLSAEDRYSKPDAFVDAKDTDYLENQCSNVLTSRQAMTCQYSVMTRDRVLSFVDRVVQTTNENDCQRACDTELQFVCRSYSFTGSQGTRSPECYLSADTRNSVGALLQNFPGANYVERICPQTLSSGPISTTFQKPSLPTGVAFPSPSGASGGGTYRGGPPYPASGPAAYPGSGPAIYPGNVQVSYPGSAQAPYPGSAHAHYPIPSGASPNQYPVPSGQYDTQYPKAHGATNPLNPFNGYPPYSGKQGTASNFPGQSIGTGQSYPSQSLYPGQSGQRIGPSNYPGQSIGSQTPYPGQAIGQLPSYPGQLPSYPGQATGQLPSYLGQPSYGTNYPESQKNHFPGQTYPGYPSGQLPSYPGQPPYLTVQSGQYPPQYSGSIPVPTATCDYAGDAIFEKTMGFAIRPLGRMEPLPASITSQHMVSDCLKACSQEGIRCQAFMIQYPFSPSATPCLSLDRGLGMERTQLLPRGDTAYFEKLCLRGKGCGKMWTFERVVGFQLDGNYDKEIRNIYKKEDCEDACLAETALPCRSAIFIYSHQLCRMTSETRRTKPESFRYVGNDVDYLENQCAAEPNDCDYTDLSNKFNPFTDRLSVRVLTLDECKKSCEQEEEFVCRSVSFDNQNNDCYMSAEDRFSTPAGPNIMIDRPGFEYAEKGGCGQVKVDCTQTEMLVTLRFGAPFNGRVYAKGNPQLCFIPGNSQTQVTMNIPIGTQCGTVEESQGRYANEIVIQQHPVIMTDHDKTYRVVCSFDMADKTLTFSPGGGGGAIDVTYGIPRHGGPPPLITNTAPTPNVRLRITDQNGQDVNAVNLGDELYFRIEPDPYSAFGVYAKNLVARSEFLDYLPLLDNTGCPSDPNVFPGLEIDKQSKALIAPFKAFRFASTGRVNFEVQIQFCQDNCQSGRCQTGNTFGRRKRDTTDPTIYDKHFTNKNRTEMTRTNATDNGNANTAQISGPITTSRPASTPEPKQKTTNVFQVTIAKPIQITTIMPDTLNKLSESVSPGTHSRIIEGTDQKKLEATQPEVTGRNAEEGNPISMFTYSTDEQVPPIHPELEESILLLPENVDLELTEEDNRMNMSPPSSSTFMYGFPSAYDGSYQWSAHEEQMEFQEAPNETTTRMDEIGIFRSLADDLTSTTETTEHSPIVGNQSSTTTTESYAELDSETEEDIPSELPLRLSLTVSGEADSEKRTPPVTVKEGSPLNTDLLGGYKHFHPDVHPAFKDLVCSPKSTVVAAVFCVIMIHVAIAFGATFYFRRRQKQKWNDAECASAKEPQTSTTIPKALPKPPTMFYRPSNTGLTFRSVDLCNRYPSSVRPTLPMNPDNWDPNCASSDSMEFLETFENSEHNSLPASSS